MKVVREDVLTLGRSNENKNLSNETSHVAERVVNKPPLYCIVIKVVR